AREGPASDSSGVVVRRSRLTRKDGRPSQNAERRLRTSNSGPAQSMPPFDGGRTPPSGPWYSIQLTEVVPPPIQLSRLWRSVLSLQRSTFSIQFGVRSS